MLAATLILGALVLSGDTGSVSQSPMFASAGTPSACPSGYGTNAALKVGKPGGNYYNLVPIAGRDNYDRAAFTMSPDRSLAKAMTGSDTGAVPDGSYEIVVLCVSETLGDHKDYFAAGITVSKGSWHLDNQPPQGSTSNGRLRITVVIEPKESQPPLPRTGSPIIWYAGAGVLLLGAGAAIVRLLRKS